MYIYMYIHVDMDTYMYVYSKMFTGSQQKGCRMREEGMRETVTNLRWKSVFLISSFDVVSLRSPNIVLHLLICCRLFGWIITG